MKANVITGWCSEFNDEVHQFKQKILNVYKWALLGLQAVELSHRDRSFIVVSQIFLSTVQVYGSDRSSFLYFFCTYYILSFHIHSTTLAQDTKILLAISFPLGKLSFSNVSTSAILQRFITLLKSLFLERYCRSTKSTDMLHKQMYNDNRYFGCKNTGI